MLQASLKFSTFSYGKQKTSRRLVMNSFGLPESLSLSCSVLVLQEQEWKVMAVKSLSKLAAGSLQHVPEVFHRFHLFLLFPPSLGSLLTWKNLLPSPNLSIHFLPLRSSTSFSLQLSCSLFLTHSHSPLGYSSTTVFLSITFPLLPWRDYSVL